jgi:diaminopimelate epimerase
MQYPIPFTKMQGLGNDFVVFNNLDKKLNFTAAQIQKIADRHYGAGCDQVLLLGPASQKDVDFDYIIFNPDGSASSQCGNGARCIARYIQLHKLSEKTTFTIATKTSIMHLTLLENGDVRVNMGIPKFTNTDIPINLAQQQEYQLEVLDQKLAFGAVSMGNPHAVVRIENFDNLDIKPLGKALNHHPAFPEGVNLGFMQILNRHHIKFRVYERGAGITLACGSGACAAMAVARQNNWVDDKVQVDLPGGSLTIEWTANQNPMWMTGPATRVYEAEWLDML